MQFKSPKELNYRMPDKCCLICDSSYFNTYGDTCCEHMGHIATIEAGGICDLFNRAYDDNIDSVPVSVDPIPVEDAKVSKPRSCANCKHSYYDNSVATCAIDREQIINAQDFCLAWEPENE